MEGIIEAILFTMGDSVEVGKIARALEQDEVTTRKVIHKLMDKYAAEDRGIRIIELDGAYQMCTKTEMYEYLIRVASQPKKQKNHSTGCLPREMIFHVISCHIFYISNFNCTSSSASSLNDSTCSGFGLGRSSSE